MAWRYKFISRLPQGFDDDDLLFLKQLGVEEAYIALPLADHNLAALKEYKDRIESAGLKMHNIHSNLYTFNHDIMLATENRDRAIDGYIAFIELLSKAGLTHLDQTASPFFVYSSNTTGLTRYCTTRSTNLNAILNNAKPFGKSAWVNPDNLTRMKQIEDYLASGKHREFSREELWDNFAYFLERIIPVIEKNHVTVSLHPSDPPCAEPICGVPQLIRSTSDYKKVYTLTNSPYLKISFCCGCWLEGGKQFGSLLDDLEWGLKDDRISMVHLRNITGPLPEFTETFLDNGYFDMYEIFRILRKYRYESYINPDHHPMMVDGEKRRSPQAYAFGYMRALASCADREFEA